jgi:hypothetical protein
MKLLTSVVLSVGLLLSPLVQAAPKVKTVLLEGGRVELYVDVPCTNDAIKTMFLIHGAPKEILPGLIAGRAISDDKTLDIPVCADLSFAPGTAITVTEDGALVQLQLGTEI